MEHILFKFKSLVRDYCRVQRGRLLIPSPPHQAKFFNGYTLRTYTEIYTACISYCQVNNCLYGGVAGTYFTNDYSIKIQIPRKVCFVLNPTMVLFCRLHDTLASTNTCNDRQDMYYNERFFHRIYDRNIFGDMLPRITNEP